MPLAKERSQEREGTSRPPRPTGQKEKQWQRHTYVSLAISGTMFPEDCNIEKMGISPEGMQAALKRDNIVSALNPSHKSTIDVIRRKFGFDLPIPERAPKVSLESGDQLIVLQAQRPRLAEGEVHSQETVENAQIKFSLYQVR